MEEQRLTDAEQLQTKSWSLKVTIDHLWLAVPIALTAGFGFLLKLRLVDFWWHLRAGEIIVTTRSIPKTDLFSFTAAGHTFILQNWLVEIIYYTTYRAGGLELLVALNAMLLVAALLPVYHLCVQATSSLKLAVMSALLPAVLLLYFGSVRTQVFSFALFSAYYWVLSNYRSRQRDLLWTLPIMMVLWVNVHGAFVLGIGLIVLFLGCALLRRAAYADRSDTLSSRELGKLGLFLILSLVATLANPETYRIYAYVRAVATNPASQALVLEWQPPRINELVGIILFYGPFFITLLALLGASRKPEFLDLVLVLCFSILGLSAVRNGVWFALIAAPVVARYLPSVDFSAAAITIRRLRVGRVLFDWLATRRGTEAPVRYRLNRQIAVLLLTIVVLVSPWVYPHLGNPAFGDTLWEKSTPVGAMDYIEQQELQGNIFHPQIFGDYLIWRLWPEQKSFVDGRVHLFDNSVIKDYRLAFNDPHWDERLASYDIKYLLLSKDEDENRMMIETAGASDAWQVLYEDPVSILFEHNRETKSVVGSAMGGEVGRRGHVKQPGAEHPEGMCDDGPPISLIPGTEDPLGSGAHALWFSAVPAGTTRLSPHPVPSDESLGYCRASLREGDLRARDWVPSDESLGYCRASLREGDIPARDWVPSDESPGYCRTSLREGDLRARDWIPSDESLGYCRASLRERDLRARDWIPSDESLGYCRASLRELDELIAQMPRLKIVNHLNMVHWIPEGKPGTSGQMTGIRSQLRL
jgi:hypothetical protein